MNMYNTELKTPQQVKASEHMEIAAKMADEIINRFTIQQQNEVVKAIYTYVTDARNRMIKDKESELEALHISYKELVG